METPDILSPEFAANPYPVYQEFRDNHPLLFHEGMNSYIISRYEDVEKAFKDKVFSSRNYDWQLEPVHGRTILQMEGTEHSRHRNLLNPAFRGRDLFEKFVPVIEKNAQDLIDKFPRDKNEIDFVSQFATIFPIGVIVDMLGLPKSDLPKFHGWYTSIMAFLSNLTQDPAVTEAGLKTKVEFEEYMLKIIQERRENPGSDLLSTLCNAEIDGVRMTDQEIKAFCSLLLTAGGETTDKALTLLFKNLIAHPEQMEAVRNDRTLIDKAFAETLRFAPPVHMIMRQPIEDVEMSGGTIPANATVTCLIGAANRDERQYEQADKFDIFRSEIDQKKAFTGAANHTAFALGRHFCVGSLLAKVEVNMATNLILDNLKNIQFKDGSPQEVGVFTRAPQEMWITYDQ
ncbi:cytochrome P450 [Tunicatimonas pelagia]|uniref:cytochrome P450 n=1 Tax=Tunicatimonas pelagia TaxID=931531 RepID=UPI0026668B19|nr:cytochrome P450 [Tunicatimonas pelagia]WKN44067.1 cytochrome P450 [Tunicatimonas pelagia]